MERTQKGEEVLLTHLDVEPEEDGSMSKKQITHFLVAMPTSSPKRGSCIIVMTTQCFRKKEFLVDNVGTPMGEQGAEGR
ncbi:hypothetical protein ZHAS_00021975 [Anopheles sinensis]|uniref:Uncharacterized protein n=1 Tax=Anopheles sinensis TaxID=74873 RepID=A0A084WTC4_ANOSI|nr:hypothetical protein ZHAS_00021975 [Anopheles sinensis]